MGYIFEFIFIYVFVGFCIFFFCSGSVLFFKVLYEWNIYNCLNWFVDILNVCIVGRGFMGCLDDVFIFV